MCLQVLPMQHTEEQPCPCQAVGGAPAGCTCVAVTALIGGEVRGRSGPQSLPWRYALIEASPSKIMYMCSAEHASHVKVTGVQHVWWAVCSTSLLIQNTPADYHMHDMLYKA